MPVFLIFLALYVFAGFGLAALEVDAKALLGALPWSVLEATHMTAMIALAGWMVRLGQDPAPRP